MGAAVSHSLDSTFSCSPPQAVSASRAQMCIRDREDVSYSESYDRLKKQLNRRRHNKTGLIPQLEQEQARLDEALMFYPESFE